MMNSKLAISGEQSQMLSEYQEHKSVESESEYTIPSGDQGERRIENSGRGGGWKREFFLVLF